MNKIICGFLCLASLTYCNVLRLIHIIVCISISFHFMAEYYTTELTQYFFSFLHSPVDGHLGYFHLLAIVHSTTLNMYVSEFECLFSFLVFCFLFLRWS